jgi:DNA-binding CsgD family transcriptional regulator/predicted ATPase
VKLAGREREFDDLVRLVGDGGPGIIRLSGRPGVGKSALLTAAVRAVPPQRCAVWRVDLRAAAAGGGLLDEIARGLGLWRSAAEPGPGDTIAAVVSAGRVVIAADHTDAVIEDPAAMAQLAAQCPHLKLVLVSRSAPDASAGGNEERLVLAPLAIPPDGAPADAVLAAPSVQLFIHRALRVHAELPLDDAALAMIGEICRLVGGLPLAIELAAARTRLLPLEQLARELGANGHDAADLDLLESARVGIRATLRSTRDLLTPSQDHLLVRLAAFRGAFPLGAVAEAVDAPLAEVLDALERLLELGLVEPSPGRADDPEFSLLPIVRSFALESAVDTAAPLTAYLRRLAAQAGADRARLVPSDAVNRLRVLRRDVGAELTRLRESDPAGAAAFAVDVASALEGFEEGAIVGETLEAVITSPAMAQLDDATQAAAWLWSSRMLALSPDGVQYSALITERWERGRALIDARQQPLAALQALMIAVHNGTTTGDFRLSMQAAMEGLGIAREAALTAWIARLELSMAGAAHHLEGPERARALGMASLERAQRIGDPTSIAWAIMMLGTLPPSDVGGQAPVPALEEALTLAEQCGDPVLLSFAFAALTMREQREGRPDIAAFWCVKRLDLARRRGWWMLSGVSLVHAVLIAAMTRAELEADLVIAHLAGVIRLDVDRVLRSMAPSTRPLFDAAVAQARGRLGDHGFAHAAAEGGMLSTPKAAALATDWLRHHARAPERAAPAPAVVSPREYEILQLLAAGLTNKEIAQRLHLSVKTVMHHSVSIYRKLAVRGRAEATAYAYRHGLVDDLTTVAFDGG